LRRNLVRGVNRSGGDRTGYGGEQSDNKNPPYPERTHFRLPIKPAGSEMTEISVHLSIPARNNLALSQHKDINKL
jgi:hypothetical protein